MRTYNINIRRTVTITPVDIECFICITHGVIKYYTFHGIVFLCIVSKRMYNWSNGNMSTLLEYISLFIIIVISIKRSS